MAELAEQRNQDPNVPLMSVQRTTKTSGLSELELEPLRWQRWFISAAECVSLPDFCLGGHFQNVRDEEPALYRAVLSWMPSRTVGRARPSLFSVSLRFWGFGVNGRMAITYSVKIRSYFARECPRSARTCPKRWYRVAMLLLEGSWKDGEVG